MPHHHFLLHKPFGYLSQLVNNQTKRKNKKLLGELYDFPEGTMAIGRLDEDSEGLLLLTTNGLVSDKVRSSQIEKEYYVQVDGIVTDEAIQKLQEGLEISVEGKKYQTLKSKAFRLTDSQIAIFLIAKSEMKDMVPQVGFLSLSLKENFDKFAK